MATPETPLNACPACRANAVARRWTGVTEVDTFDHELGASTEHHFRDQCGECQWQWEGVTKVSPERWRDMQTAEDRLWHGQHPEAYLEGSLFLELEIRAEVPSVWARPPRSDVSRILRRCLERDALVRVPVRFATERGTFEFSLHPHESARAATSLQLQLEQADVARAMLGGESDPFLEVHRHGSAQVARLFHGRFTHAMTSASSWLGAVDSMWNDHFRPRMIGAATELAAVLGEALAAITAGMGAPVGAAVPFEPTAMEALRSLAADVASEIEEQATSVDGDVVWAGTRPDTSLTFPNLTLEWNQRAAEQSHAFFCVVRPGRIVMATRADGRVGYFEERFTAGYPAGVGERLSFAWRHRRTFVDGLWFVDGVLDAMEPQAASPAHPLTLHAVHGEVDPITIAPTAGATLGRAPHAEISVDHRLLSKRHALISINENGWRIADAGSTSGILLNGEALRDSSAPLILGDEIMLAGLRLIVDGSSSRAPEG